VPKRRKSTGGQKTWLDARLLAYLGSLVKTRFDRASVSLGKVAEAMFPNPPALTTREDDPYGLSRLDHQKRILLIEGSARRLERGGLLIFHPHSKRIERAKSLLEVLAYVSRDDEEIRETG